ncbi:nuclear GTP-binding protein, partial [Tremellales sp. Uapishka_1]
MSISEKNTAPNRKVYATPTTQKRRDLGVPKLGQAKSATKQQMPYGKSKPEVAATLPPKSMASLQATSTSTAESINAFASTSQLPDNELVDASLTVRDSSAKAFMRELRKVIERSDVVIQVLDARDPEGTRSRWVEDEVRKRAGQGKKLLAVVNKIDLVPRANLEAWLRYLRHSFPCMPFKSSTQAQRQHLSQNAVPVAPTQPATIPGQAAPVLPPLPVTSSSLGAPALLHLLKQYALSTPHSSLTVGVIGYPNVGKSSLINSLKRSKACGVAAMPGKTRVVQEVALDKGVKILDCPGVVLEDFGRDTEGEEARKRQAEVMLRNCVKAELVEDPTAPVQVILERVDPELLQKLYSIPAFTDMRDFLIKIALTRGRLGKGGIPDLHGSAISVLRDWNSGKIPFHTKPPAVHPSSAPIVPIAGQVGDVEMGEQVGDARILNTLSEAFTLDGLFDDMGDEAAWEGEETALGDEGMLAEDAERLETATEPIPVTACVPDSPSSSSDGSSTTFRHPLPLPKVALPSLAPVNVPFPARNAPVAHPSKLFTPEELAVLPTFDRQKLKAQAKKAKKRKLATERTEGELMLGFMGMEVDEVVEGGEAGEVSMEERREGRKSKKEKRKLKKVSEKKQPAAMEIDEDVQKEQDFAKFLAGVGAGDSDDEL